MNDWDDAERHAERAHQYFEAGQWSRAADELRLALSVNPEQSEWHFGLGLTLDAMQKYREAIVAYEQVMHLRGDDVETLLRLGIDLIREEEPKRAIEVLERAARFDSNCEPSYCHRIVAYTQLGDHTSAEMMFYLARQIVDECPQCYDHIAQSLAMRGKLDRAIWCWHRALKLDHHYPGALTNLAHAHWYRGQHERARQYFLQQLRQEPGDTDVMIEVGNLLIEMGRRSDAAEKFRRVLELDPGMVEAHLRLGELALAEGHLDAAAKRFERARLLDGECPGVHLGLGQIAQRRGQIAQAREHLSGELKRDGQTPEQLLEMARMLIELELVDDALGMLDPLIADAKSPLAVGGPHILASALVCRGVARIIKKEMREGIADCRRAARLAPDNGVAMENLALAYLQTGELRRAKVCLQRAREARPGDKGLRHLAYRLRWRMVMGRFSRNHSVSLRG